MNLVQQTTTACRAMLILGLVCCGLYPLLVTGVGQLFFPKQANGSLILDREKTHLGGSAWLGQNFNGPTYFHPRPSNAGPAGYDPTSSGGSNLGPTSKALIDTIQQRVVDYRKSNGLPDSQLVPADAVTSSASGVDPDISLKNALLQLPRVARQRNLTVSDLHEVLQKHVERPDFGLFGETRVNVLLLNLDLDGKME